MFNILSYFKKERERSNQRDKVRKDFYKVIDDLGYTDFYKEYSNDEIFGNWKISRSVERIEKKNNIRKKVSELRDALDKANTFVDKEMVLSVLSKYYIDYEWLLNDDLSEVSFSDDELKYIDFVDKLNTFHRELASL